MAELRPTAVLYPAGGIGLANALRKTVKPGTIVSAFNDQALSTAQRILLEPNSDLTEDDIDFRPIGDLLRWIANMCGVSTGKRISQSQLTALIMKAGAKLPEESDYRFAKEYIGTAQVIGECITELHQSKFDCAQLKINCEPTS